ncbi:MAG TPA: Gfo/Idh/MocA family oxidoreductase [Pseudonocardia sp.]|nr:Gfo/Idh/MocA family oxidoreductase [Pseudonocardia sp.]
MTFGAYTAVPHEGPIADAPAPSSEPLRIGILGAARITDLALVGPARTTGDRLVAVAARARHRAEAFAAEHGVERVVDDYASVLADDEVEVVYNPLANALHGPWNAAAAHAGKHVLSEKPFAANADEARLVADAARTAGVSVVEAFHYLHHPVMRRVLELLDAGELGDLREVEAHITMAAPPPDDPRWSFELAGGAVMDLGCYGLHAHRSLAPWGGGEPRVVGARGAERNPGVDEWVEAELAFPGGASGFVYCSMSAQSRMTLRVVGSMGEVTAANFVLPHLDDRVLVRTGCGASATQRTEHLGTRSSYTYQLEALRAHLRDGAPLAVDASDAVVTAELIDAVYTAAGLPVRPATALTP